MSKDICTEAVSDAVDIITRINAAIGESEE